MGIGFEESILKNNLADKNKRRDDKIPGEYEELLWKKMELIATSRKDFQSESDSLYAEIEAINKIKTGLHHAKTLREKEDRFWGIQKEIERLKKEENDTIMAIDALERGDVKEDSVRILIADLKVENEKHISKRRQRILEERERLGEYYTDMEYGPGGKPQVAHPTTGRNLKSVKMNTNSLDAAGEFFYRTADTHGGKVNAGKHGRVYADKSGKMIRKK